MQKKSIFGGWKKKTAQTPQKKNTRSSPQGVPDSHQSVGRRKKISFIKKQRARRKQEVVPRRGAGAHHRTSHERDGFLVKREKGQGEGCSEKDQSHRAPKPVKAPGDGL